MAENCPPRALRARIRLDYKAEAKKRFLARGKPSEKIAEEIREQKVILFRNVPFQGIVLEDIDVSPDVYMVTHGFGEGEVAYAPVILTLQAEGLEDLLCFVFQEEFRKIEILAPAELTLTRYEVERLLFALGREASSYREFLERKLSSRV